MDGPSLAFSTPTTAMRHSALAPRRAPSLPLPKVLLCDLDGTLIDTMPVLADLATDVLSEQYGLPRSLGRELYLSTCGLPFFQQLDAICPGDARNAFAADLFESRKPARCRAARMPTDTRGALFALQGRGVRIAISSNNGIDNVQAFARDSRFPFDLVLGFGDGMAKGKPHVARTIDAFGVGVEDLMFVGDSLHDGEIANAVDLSFIGLAGTFSKERFALRFPGTPVVSRFSDIPDLFE